MTEATKPHEHRWVEISERGDGRHRQYLCVECNHIKLEVR